MKQVNNTKWLFLFVVTILVSSCSVSHFIPKNKKLYGGGEIKISNSNRIQNLEDLKIELQSLVTPKPNSKFLGAKIGLYHHYKVKKGSSNIISKYIDKKHGEEPVYFTDINAQKVVDIIKNRLNNRGFFNSDVKVIIREKKHSKSIVYVVNLSKPYLLKSYQITNDSLPIHGEIKKAMQTTLLTQGSAYNLASFKKERIKIDQYLKAKGYYNFNEDFIVFEADTNQQKSKKFNLYLKIKNDTPKEALLPYKIHKVVVYPKHNINQTNKKLDSIDYKSVLFAQDQVFFKPKRLRNYLMFQKGDLYQPNQFKITSKRLSSIGTYKYVNIQFDQNNEITEQDSVGYLDTSIYLSPLNKRALSLELQAVTKSNNFTGPEISVSYKNRNLFKGGEMLTLKGSFAYETQLGKNTQKLSGLKVGLGASLLFPRLIFPGNLIRRFKYGVPSTKIAFDSEYLSRSNLYQLASFTSNYGYFWDANKFVTHQINVVNINFVKLFNTSSEFQNILKNNLFLQSSFEQQFIAGLTYNMTYSELGKNDHRSQLFVSTNLDLAGNALSLLASSGVPNKKTFLGLKYAQYAKIDVDFRYYRRLGKEQTLVGRFYAGLGIPYGNSKVLPFTKQFFAGGPNSIRGFVSRSIGPGSYKSTNKSSFFDSSGDLHLETNLEYRFPVYSFIKGAMFADAGNVWLYHKNNALVGGQFSSNFLNEMAVSAGVGLRADIQSFVLRFDLAAPLKKPNSTSFNKPNLNSSILNFAIGYPF